MHCRKKLKKSKEVEFILYYLNVVLHFFFVKQWTINYEY